MSTPRTFLVLVLVLTSVGCNSHRKTAARALAAATSDAQGVCQTARTQLATANESVTAALQSVDTAKKAVDAAAKNGKRPKRAVDAAIYDQATTAYNTAQQRLDDAKDAQEQASKSESAACQGQ